MLRGVLRDFLSLYVGYKILGIWLFDAKFTPGIGWAALFLFILAVWFIFERVGILPKFG